MDPKATKADVHGLDIPREKLHPRLASKEPPPHPPVPPAIRSVSAWGSFFGARLIISGEQDVVAVKFGPVRLLFLLVIPPSPYDIAGAHTAPPGCSQLNCFR